MLLRGTVKKGFQIASGLNPDPSLKLNNTIALQKPFFEKAAIPHIEKTYNGTINLDISPREFTILSPDHKVTCEWIHGVTETFWLVEVAIVWKNIRYRGYIYYPCPSPVKSHDDTVVEILAEKIPDLGYGDTLVVQMHPRKIMVKENPRSKKG